MATFRKKPVAIEATQWFKNGDHPDDEIEMIDPMEPDEPLFPSEGKVVRYFRRSGVPGEQLCRHCGQTMHVHGWIDTIEGGHIVCPGDWIITGVQGERYPCKPDIFAATYVPATDHACQFHKGAALENCLLCFREHPLIQQLRQVRDANGDQPASLHQTNVTVALGAAMEHIARADA